MDETQDLSHEALRLVRAIAGPEGPNDLLLVGDSHQRIYGRATPLSECGINVRGRRSRELRLNYRTTAAICRWSLGALGRREFDDLDGGKSTTHGYISLRQGAVPVVRHFADKSAERAFVVAQVKQLLDGGMLPEEICIVARTKNLLTGSYAPSLETSGVECELLETDTPRASSVRLATMHRVKGLEFPAVFLVAANDGFVPLDTPDLASSDPLVAAHAELQERCLLYVATSRARDQLFVTSYDTQSPFVVEMGLPKEPAPRRRRTVAAMSATPAASPPSPVAQEEAGRVEVQQMVDVERSAVPSPAPTLQAPPDKLMVEPWGGFSPLICPLVPEGEPNPALAAPLWIDRAEQPAAPRRVSKERLAAPVEVSSPPEFTDWHLPTRMSNWLDRHGIRTIEQLVALDPDMLREERNLGRKTIAETAAVIQHKMGNAWEALCERSAQSTEDEGASDASDLGPVLDTALSELECFPKIAVWAEHNGVATLRGLVATHPLELVQDPTLERTLVAELRTIVESKLGRRWEEAQRLLSSGKLEGQTRWDSLKVTLPAVILRHALVEVDLPTRMRSYVARTGMRKIAELVAVRQTALVDEPNLGRGSVAAAARALLDYSERAEQRLRKWQAGYLAALKDMFSELETVARMIVSRRAGLGSAPETLEELGTTLGVSRERVRQIEKKTWDNIVRSDEWCRFVREQCEAVAPSGAVALDVLERTPWWLQLAGEPDALDYFCDHILAGAWRVITIEDERYLANASQRDVDEARASAIRTIKQLQLPMALRDVEAKIRATALSLAPALQQLVWEEVRYEIAVDGEGEEARATAFGNSKSAQVLAFLERQPAPVPVAELVAEVGRAAVPDEVFFFGHGVVGLEKHFPDFQGWRSKVAPVAIRLIEESGPERQWSCADLLPSVREELSLPNWLGYWHLAMILRRSEGIEYLGRLRVALPGVVADSSRILIHDAAKSIVQSAGAPISWEELARQLRSKLDVSDIALVGLLNRPPFLKTKKRTFGLFERDLPGGIAAMADALDEIEAVLERRQRGVSAKYLHQEIGRMSAVHASWSQEMCLSVVRSDPRFRLTISGNVGLAAWESVRVPSRIDVVQEALGKSEGRVSVAAVQERIEALYDEKPDRVHLGQLANRFGARLDGDWLVLGE